MLNQFKNSQWGKQENADFQVPSKSVRKQVSRTLKPSPKQNNPRQPSGTEEGENARAVPPLLARRTTRCSTQRWVCTTAPAHHPAGIQRDLLTHFTSHLAQYLKEPLWRCKTKAVTQCAV